MIKKETMILRPILILNTGIFLGLFLIFFALNNANAEIRFPIKIEHYGKDYVGEMVVSELKKRLINAKNFRQFNGPEPCIKMIITTMPRLEKYEDSASIYSVIWFYDKINDNNEMSSLYLSNSIGYCGSLKYQEAAQKILKMSEDVVNDLLVSISKQIDRKDGDTRRSTPNMADFNKKNKSAL